MKKLFQLQCALLREIEKYEKVVAHRDQPIDWERVHMASCARIGYLLAEERGFDPDLASFACAVHDYGRIVNGKQADHAEFGYPLVKGFLRKMEFLSEEEIEAIALAVKNHSKKGEVGSPLEEVVKDADVIDFYQYGYGFAREEQRERWEKLENARLLK